MNKATQRPSKTPCRPAREKSQIHSGIAGRICLAFCVVCMISDLYAEAQELRVLENERLRISFASDSRAGTGARFDVLDKRTGRVWKQTDAKLKTSDFRLSKNTASFAVTLPNQADGYHATVRLEPDKPEFSVELTG